MKRGLLIGAGCLLIVAVVAFYFLRGSNKGEKYETVEVDRGDIIEKITATGHRYFDERQSKGLSVKAWLSTGIRGPAD